MPGGCDSRCQPGGGRAGNGGPPAQTGNPSRTGPPPWTGHRTVAGTPNARARGLCLATRMTAVPQRACFTTDGETATVPIPYGWGLIRRRSGPGRTLPDPTPVALRLPMGAPNRRAHSIPVRALNGYCAVPSRPRGGIPHVSPSATSRAPHHVPLSTSPPPFKLRSRPPSPHLYFRLPRRRCPPPLMRVPSPDGGPNAAGAQYCLPPAACPGLPCILHSPPCQKRGGGDQHLGVRRFVPAAGAPSARRCGRPNGQAHVGPAPTVQERHYNGG